MSGMQNGCGRDAANRRRLAVTYSLEPFVDRGAGCDSLQFTAEEPLHGLTLSRSPHRKRVTDLFRDVPYRDLH